MPVTSNVPVQNINAYTLASQWLTALGWPNTPANQRALAAWFLAESSHTGLTLHVLGNNPLNITGGNNYRLVGTHRISVYNSPAAGINAFSRLINTSGHNYPGIVAAFKNENNPISAIVNSGWVTGGTGPSYWHKGRNLLLDVFNGLPGPAGNVTPPISGGYPPTTGGEQLGAWGNLVSFPVGHKLTPEDVDYIMSQLVKGGLVGSVGPDYDIVKGILEQSVGQEWNKTLEETLQQKFFAAGVLAGNTIGNPVGTIATDFIGPAVMKVLGTFGSIAVLIGGGALVLFGLYLITKEATGSSPEGMVSPVPVFIREGV